MTQSSQPKRGDVLVLVGTRKGGFILSSEPARNQWSVFEPQFSGGKPVTLDVLPGAPSGSGPAGDIFHMAFDPRDGGTIIAVISSIIWGLEIHRSRDYGNTWQSSSEGPRFSDGDRDGEQGVAPGARPSRGAGCRLRGGRARGVVQERGRWRHLERGHGTLQPSDEA